jgi:hypothetical protein
MLTPGGPVTPGSLGRRTRRRVGADDVGTVLATQWPGPAQAQAGGWSALARALLAAACLDAGLAQRRGPVWRRDRWSAARYLLETEPDVPLPLPVACALAGLDAARVRAVARLRLP